MRPFWAITKLVFFVSPPVRDSNRVLTIFCWHSVCCSFHIKFCFDLDYKLLLFHCWRLENWLLNAISNWCHSKIRWCWVREIIVPSGEQPKMIVTVYLHFSHCTWLVQTTNYRESQFLSIFCRTLLIYQITPDVVVFWKELRCQCLLQQWIVNWYFIRTVHFTLGNGDTINPMYWDLVMMSVVSDRAHGKGVTKGEIGFLVWI